MDGRSFQPLRGWLISCVASRLWIEKKRCQSKVLSYFYLAFACFGFFPLLPIQQVRQMSSSSRMQSPGYPFQKGPEMTNVIFPRWSQSPLHSILLTASGPTHLPLSDFPFGG